MENIKNSWGKFKHADYEKNAYYSNSISTYYISSPPSFTFAFLTYMMRDTSESRWKSIENFWKNSKMHIFHISEV